MISPTLRRLQRLRDLAGLAPDVVADVVVEELPRNTSMPKMQVSTIDPAFPIFGSPTTASVRGNFQAARDEIEALQDGKLDLGGGIMTGPIEFAPDQDVDGGTFV